MTMFIFLRCMGGKMDRWFIDYQLSHQGDQITARRTQKKKHQELGRGFRNKE